MTCKVNRGVLADSNRCGRTNISTQTQICGFVHRGKVRRQVTVTVQQRIPFRILLKFLCFAFVSNSSDFIGKLSIIRRLRRTFGFRVIRQRDHPESIVASLAALDLVTILVFGTLVVSVAYISRLT